MLKKLTAMGSALALSARAPTTSRFFQIRRPSPPDRNDRHYGRRHTPEHGWKNSRQNRTEQQLSDVVHREVMHCLKPRCAKSAVLTD